MRRPRTWQASAFCSLGLFLSVLVGASPASAMPHPEATACVTAPAAIGTAEAARGGHGVDTREVSPRQQRAIEARTRHLLAAKGAVLGRRAAVEIAVYVHVMASASGAGDVSQTRIDRQIVELNQDFAGGESAAAADTGFTFALAGVDRWYDDAWHQNQQASAFRAATRLGGKESLNIWVLDMNYLGIATFPWDYAASPDTDGIRVQYTTLPGGIETNYNLGKTASHETGHWLGLYHTFEGGCTTPNDRVSDTPAQASATGGCPTGRNSCSLAGKDPIHNYLDYSYDSCYNQFTAGQSNRMSQMWQAYRA